MSGAFALPLLLALAPLVAAAVAWSWAHEARRRRAALDALGDAALLGRVGRLPSGAGRAARAWLRGAALALAAVALARPQLGDVTGGARMGRDLVVALDLSRSMRVEDAGGSRLDRAKAIARELSAEFAGDRVALVIFGGSAFLQLPLTTDHDVFARFLASVSPASLDDASTNLGAPLELAATALAHEGSDGHRALVLLSDGEDGAEQVARGLEKLQGTPFPVFAIGVGTAAGGLVPADSGTAGTPWHVDFIGRPVSSRLEEGALQQVAAATGGRYARWDDAGARRELAAALRDVTLRPLGGSAAPEPREDFQWPLGLAVVLLVADLWLGFAPARRRTRVPARVLQAATLAAVVLVAGCVTDRVARLQGQRAWERGDFAAARAHWQAALARRPDPRTSYNLGSALHRLGRFEEAVPRFREALQGPPALQAAAHFNLGTAAVRAAELNPERRELLDEAVTSLEAALLLAPGDSAAKWNLEVALRRRGSPEAAGSPGRGGRAQAGAGDGREEGLDSQRETAIGAMAGGGHGDAQGESAEELDAESARRLLDAIEREQLSSHEGRPARRGQRADRDW